MITKESFFENEFISGGDAESTGKIDFVLKFLRDNKNQAFMVKEISDGTKIDSKIVTSRLGDLKRKKRILNKRPYWTYNDKFRETEERSNDD